MTRGIYYSYSIPAEIPPFLLKLQMLVYHSINQFNLLLFYQTINALNPNEVLLNLNR